MRLFSLLLLFVWLAGCTAPEQPTLTFYASLQRADLDQLKRHIYWETDLNQQLLNGDNALHIAVRKGNPVFVDLLIKHSIDLDHKNASGNTPLDTALINGRKRIAEQLIKQGAKFEANSSLKMVVQKHVTNPGIYQLLQKLGANPNQTLINNDSLLNYAIESDQRLVVKRLISMGAVINGRDANGKLPLELAERSSEPEIKTLLLQNGAEPLPLKP